MGHNYLIPANSKKSMLIFGFFTPVDLGIFATGSVITIMMLLILDTNDLMTRLAECIPLFTSLFLVMPLPHYHNVMTLIGNIIHYFTNQRDYIWRGWCVKREFNSNNERR